MSMPEEYEPWRSDDLDIPLQEFMAMFKLTQQQMRVEGGSGRIVAASRPDRKHPGYIEIRIKESAARAWVVHAELLPKPVQRKVEKAGGLAALERWRGHYFSQIKLDVANNAMILPDGTRIENVRARKADVERIWPLGGDSDRH